MAKDKTGGKPVTREQLIKGLQEDR